MDYKKYYPIRPMHFDPPQAIDHRMYEDRKLCTMIASLKVKYDELDCLYRERKKTADWFAEKHPEDFDFYCHKERYAENACYRGSVEDKIDTLSKYRFSICYENMKDCPGYISEKIFDSMYAGCIPVYWGEADITKYIPEDCFIDRRKFASHEALYDYMASMTKEEWNRYYDNMMQLLKTSEFVQSYRPEAFAESLEKYFLQELCEDR